MTDTRKHLLFIAIVGFLVYANSLGNGFVWDDRALVTGNVFVHDWRHLPKLFTTNLFAGASGRSAFYRPVQALTYTVEYHLWGKSAFGFHLTNMLLHLGNAMLLYLLIAPIATRRAAMVAGLLFVAHPLQTEAITYISGRADPLALCFMLLALLAYRQARAHITANLWRFASLAAFMMALLSKEMAMIFPALLILYDVTTDPPAHPRDLLWRLGRRYWPYLAIVALYGGLRRLIPDLYVVPPGPQMGLGHRVLLMLSVLSEYLSLLAIPRDLHMERVFPIPTSLLNPTVLIGALSILLLIGLAWWAWPRARLLTFGISWFFVAFLPISNLVPLNAFMAEHWMYLPGIGLFLVAGLGLDAVPGRVYRQGAIGVFAVVLLLYAGISFRRNLDWKDEATFYTLTMKAAPESIRVRINLGRMYLEKGEAQKAEAAFQSALRIDPLDLWGHLGIAQAYEKMGRDQDAITQFEKALLIYPRALIAHIHLAELYMKMGLDDKATQHLDASPLLGQRFAFRLVAAGDRHMKEKKYGEAVNAYQKSLEMSPSNPDFLSKLGLAYAAMGQDERAKREYERALEINPKSLNARNYLGAYFLKNGLWEKAAEQFQEVLRIAPEHADALNNLGIAHHQMGRPEEAEAELRKALALRPDSPEIKKNLENVTSGSVATSPMQLEHEMKTDPQSARAHYNLGSAYGNKGDLERASKEFAIALRLDPRNPLIHYAIGLLHYQKGERAQAQRAWERAVQLDPAFAPALGRLAELRSAGPKAERAR